MNIYIRRFLQPQTIGIADKTLADLCQGRAERNEARRNPWQRRRCSSAVTIPAPRLSSRAASTTSSACADASSIASASPMRTSPCSSTPMTLIRSPLALTSVARSPISSALLGLGTSSSFTTVGMGLDFRPRRGSMMIRVTMSASFLVI